MKISAVTNGDATCILAADELRFLCNAVNETLEALEHWEFETRTGKTRAFASSLQEQLNRTLSAIAATPNG